MVANSKANEPHCSGLLGHGEAVRSRVPLFFLSLVSLFVSLSLSLSLSLLFCELCIGRCEKEKGDGIKSYICLWWSLCITCHSLFQWADKFVGKTQH